MGIWEANTFRLREASSARRRIMLDKQEGSTPYSSPISIQLMNLHQLLQTANFSNFISVKKAKYRTRKLLMAKTTLKQIKANRQFK